jgi:hypothetical protein
MTPYVTPCNPGGTSAASARFVTPCPPPYRGHGSHCGGGGQTGAPRPNATPGLRSRPAAWQAHRGRRHAGAAAP